MAEAIEKKAKCSIGKAAAGAFTETGAVVALAAMIISLLTVFTSQPNVTCIIDTVINYVLMLVINFCQYLNLRQFNLERKDLAANAKALDNRLCSAFNDVRGVGKALAIISGVCILIYFFFIGQGNVFHSGTRLDLSLLSVALSSIAETVGITGSLMMFCSLHSIQRSLYIIAGKTIGASGDELLKKACNAVRYELLMKRVRASLTVRISAVIILSSVIIMLGLSGAGVPFFPAQTTIMYAVIIIVSDFCTKANDKKTDKKLPIWEKNNKSVAIVNILSSLMITFFFMFTFPVQSVFVKYNTRTIYDYDEVVDYSIKMFSVPVRGEDTAALFSGMVIILNFILILIHAVMITDYSDIKSGGGNLRKYSSCIMGIVLIVVLNLISGICYQGSGLTAVQWLVSVTFVCLMIFINIACGIIRNVRKKDED